MLRMAITLAFTLALCVGFVHATYDRQDYEPVGLATADLHEIMCDHRVFFIPIPNDVPETGLDYYARGFCHSIK